jgi:protein TonB
MRDAARKIDAGFSGLATAVRAPATRAPLLVAAPAPLSHLRATPAVVRVLDRPAAPSRTEYNRPPAYPETARQSGMEGTVVLAVGVAPTGAPDAVAVTASSGFALLDEAARNAVRRWSFDPAYHAGIPVRGFAKVAVRFDLVDAD